MIDEGLHDIVLKKRVKTTKIKDNKMIKKSEKSNSFHSLIDFHLK